MDAELIFDTVDSANPDSGFRRADVVKMYKEDTKLDYPCIMLTCDKLEKFRVEALKGILGNKTLIVDDSMYTVYIQMQGNVVGVGRMSNTRLKVLLGNKVFDPFEKKVHLNSGTIVEGDMLYALCMTV